MKDFHHNYLCRPTENSKKEQKTSRSHHCSMCKCVKLHYHDCPMIMHPCPLHGSPFHSEEKIDKADRGQNVIFSFHPSSRTERLLQPIKSLLANCKSETKINFQYYTPPNSISSESVGPNYGQNALEQLKRNLNNSFFMDRTKSFVLDKTNKVKKLKECFYSPCGSVARKSRSQTSIKDKLNQAFFNDHKETQNALYKIMSELPPNDLRNYWFYPRKLSNEKFPSDFITVTKHDKNNIINHKIFEIKHETEGDDVSFVGFPKPQNQFVYAATSVKEDGRKPKKKFQLCKKKRHRDIGTGPDPQEPGEPPPEPEEVRDTVSQKSNTPKFSRSGSSISSGSVYITPFIFVPKGAESRERNTEIFLDYSSNKNDKGVQVGEPFSSDPSTKYARKNDRQCEVVFCTPCKCQDGKMRTIIQQTESSSPVSSRQTSGVRDPGPKTNIEDNYVERVSNFMKPSDYSQSRQSCPMSSRTSKRSTQNTSAPEDGYQCKEISVNARWGSGMKDQTSQTEEWSFHLSVKTFESKTNKSQGTSPRHSERGLKTVYYHMTPSHNRSEFINIKAPQNSYATDQYPDSDDSDKVEKIWIGRSRSDSNVFERGKCECCKSDTDRDHKGSEKEIPRGRDSPREKPSNRLSDLSELKHYIRELFHKENLAHKNYQWENPNNERPPVEFKSIHTSTSKEHSVDAEVQTVRYITFEKPQNAEVQTSVSLNGNEKKNTEAQTDVGVFLEEQSEDPSGGPKKIKVCRTVILDPENESKTFFICTVCGRDITVISKNAATSTVDLKSAPFVKLPYKTTTTNINENEVTKWTETHLEIKKVKKPKQLPQKTTSSQNERDRPGERPSKISRPQRIIQKSTVPVQPMRTRNDFDNYPRGSSVSYSGQNLHNDVKITPSTRDCECDCTCSPTPSETLSQNHNYNTKPSSGKTAKQLTEYFYPVITSRMWPKEFLQNWKSIESSRSKPSKLDLVNQKRTYEKGFESTALGKRIKVDEKTPFPTPSSTVSGLLVKGDDGGYKFWPSSFVDCPEFQFKNELLDENDIQDSLSTLQLDDILQDSLSTLQLEDILQDDLLTSPHSSENIITSRSSFLAEMEEQKPEALSEEPKVSSLPNRPVVVPQSHSVFNFNSFSNSDVSTNSKSLNSFGFIREPKKMPECL